MTINPLFLTLDDLMLSYQVALKRTFWATALGLLAVFILQTEHPGMEVVAACYALGAISLLPLWLWINRRVTGLPIVPAIAMLDLVFVVLPVLNFRTSVSSYSNSAHLAALAAQALFLIVMTAVWYKIASRPAPFPKRALMLDPRKGHNGFYQKAAVAIMLVVLIYQMAENANLVYEFILSKIGFGWRNPIVSVITLMSLVGSFVLCLSIGQRSLSPMMMGLSIALIAATMLVNAVSLILANLTNQFFACLAGYILGRGRIPWVGLAIFLFTINLLHLGKWEMRHKYWEIFDGTQRALTIVDYPSFYAEWMGHGFDHLTGTAPVRDKEDRTNLLERSAVVQIVLYAQRHVPDNAPYLMGATYTVIPELLIPRILHPNKPRSHEGQVILNVRLGMQTLSQTQTTYIAWGMLAEAYANFGWPGVILLGVILGWTFGKITALSALAPLASYRFAIASIFFLLALNCTQAVASIVVTTVFQTVIVASFLCLIVMSKQEHKLSRKPEELSEEEQEPFYLDANQPEPALSHTTG